VDDTALAYFLTTNDMTSLCKFNSNVDDFLIVYVNLGFISRPKHAVVKNDLNSSVNRRIYVHTWCINLSDK
jgi:hypothetical protein